MAPRKKITLELSMTYIGTLGKRTTTERMFILYLIWWQKDKPWTVLQGAAARMAAPMEMSGRTIQRVVAALKARGILIVQNNNLTDGKIAANSYSLPGWNEFTQENL